MGRLSENSKKNTKEKKQQFSAMGGGVKVAPHPPYM